jgi:hypothetical protein
MFKRILVSYDESPAIRTCTTHRHPSRQELKCRVEGSVGASASLSRRITEALTSALGVLPYRIHSSCII